MISSGSSFGTSSSTISIVTHDSLSVGEKDMVVLTVTKSEPATKEVICRLNFKTLTLTLIYE